MRIQADCQRQIIAHDGADAAQQFSLGVRKTIDQRGAVQIKIHAVERPLIQRHRQRRADARGDPLECFILHRPGGIGETPGKRNQFSPGRFRHSNCARQWHGAGASRRNEIHPGAKRWQPARLEEIGVTRWPRRE